MPHQKDLIKEFENMRDRMHKWLEYSSQHRVCHTLSGKPCWIPAADIHETENTYHVFVDLAGVDPSAIEVIIEGNVLYLNGQRPRPRVDNCHRVHQLEVDSGAFRRVFQFPSHLDPDGAESSYRHGFLEIILPKLQKPQAVQIPLHQK